MAKSLALLNIGWPTDYIRKQPDMDHIRDLMDVFDRSEKAYPFTDPLTVRQLDKPTLYAMTLGGKGATCEYELTKGLHRGLALQLRKEKTAVCDIVRFSSDEVESGEALFAQYDNHGVLKVSIQDRARFIKALRSAPYKWPVETVAERFKISTASVSRIARNLQATGPSGKPRKKRGTKKTTAEAVATFVPSEWFTILGELITAYQDGTNAAGILGMIGTVDPGLIAESVIMVTELDKVRNGS